MLSMGLPRLVMTDPVKFKTNSVIFWTNSVMFRTNPVNLSSFCVPFQPMVTMSQKEEEKMANPVILRINPGVFRKCLVIR